MKILIVGGVAAGASCAARIRRLDEKAEIIIFEKTGYISYANCGLPYYIGDVITDKEELTLQTPESFFQRFRIDVRVRQEVTELSSENRTVTVLDYATGKQYRENYDRLVLAPGAKAFVPRMEGMDSGRVMTLRTVEDTLKIKTYVDKEQPKSAVIAGGGYIGIEMAENLCERGIQVTIVQRPDQLMAPLDFDMAAMVHGMMRKNGVALKLGSSVKGFHENKEGIETFLEDDTSLQSDFVILAVGVVPDTAFLKNSGIELGVKGSIVTNEKMETSLPGVYAAGDAAEVNHFVTGERALISLAGPANKQGRIIADNICGLNSIYRGSQGSSVVKLFRMTVATTGINEKNAKAAGIDYDYIIIHPASHASYYPGARTMTMKVLFEKGSGRLLGAQIAGYDGVDKRIDVLATAIRANMKAEDLKDLDLAYAPPYSSAKDPVNMAGFVIENILTDKIRQFYYEDLEKLQKEEGVTLLDTRTEQEYIQGHIPGFINIPLDDLRDRFGELPVEKPVYAVCQTGLRSYIACRILKQKGYETYNFTGGYRYYRTVHSEILMREQSYPCGMEKNSK